MLPTKNFINRMRRNKILSVNKSKEVLKCLTILIYSKHEFIPVYAEVKQTILYNSCNFHKLHLSSLKTFLKVQNNKARWEIVLSSIYPEKEMSL